MTEKALLRAISFTLSAMAAPISIAASAAGCDTVANTTNGVVTLAGGVESEEVKSKAVAVTASVQAWCESTTISKWFRLLRRSVTECQNFQGLSPT